MIVLLSLVVQLQLPGQADTVMVPFRPVVPVAVALSGREEAWGDPAAGGEVAAVLGSALVPGLGQWKMGQRRWTLYGAADLGGWAGLLHHRQRGHRFRGAFRDLAWEAARRPMWDGPRREGSWEYYETMANHDASGRFDLDPTGPEIVPETDPATFNGQVWMLAMQLHLPGGPNGDPDPASPEYRRALEYYEGRAITPEFAWDWSGDEDERARYRALIRRSDDARRTATNFIGLLLVNRFVSVVDAHLAARSSEQRVRMSAAPVWGGATPATRWTLTLRVLPTSRTSRPSHR